MLAPLTLPQCLYSVFISPASPGELKMVVPALVFSFPCGIERGHRFFLSGSSDGQTDCVTIEQVELCACP